MSPPGSGAGKVDGPLLLDYPLTSMSDTKESAARLKFDGKNGILLGAAIISLVAGYYLLAQGSTTLAPALLVAGYCVFFPLGLAL